MKRLWNYKGYIILGLGIIGLIVMNFTNLVGSDTTDAMEFGSLFTNVSTEPDESEYIVVEVKGEVFYPGIYQVEPKLRVGDVLTVAGGLKSTADISEVNLAARISDEMVITIPKQETITTTISAGEIVRIVVEIKGEVVNPGVYYLYLNSRVKDLIDAAGGLTENANIDNIDLARILTDGESITVGKEIVETVEEIKDIYVQITGEVIRPGTYLIPENYTLKQLIYAAGGVTVNCDIAKIDWDIVLVLGASIYIPAYGDELTPPDVSSGKININKADLETLITLPGIGDIIGQRIIDYRAEYGDFLTIEDIMKVSGIKESVYEQIKDLITV